jgi:hypothetical protein
MLKVLGFTIVMLALGAISHWGLTLNSIWHLALGGSLFWLGTRLR